MRREGGRGTAEYRHAAKVERIVESLRAQRDDKPVSLRKKAVSHQVSKDGDLSPTADRLGRDLAIALGPK